MLAQERRVPLAPKERAPGGYLYKRHAFGVLFWVNALKYKTEEANVIFRVCTVALCAAAVWTSSASAQKSAALASIENHEEAYWEAAMDIWRWAEPGYQEVKSSDRLATMLEKSGFTVEKGVARIPTAFTASYGSGKPIIGILGEFDALPGLAQEAVPERDPVAGARYGHGCGHHLLGVASAAAAIAIADQMKSGNLSGTVRFYGTPAEEGGSGKVYMTRAGLFDDCDAVLHWHPGSRNSAGDPTNMARIAVKFRFYGISAHAASAPEQGRSALDAVLITNHAAELLREHTPDFTRIHYVITAGGDAPNIVPNFAEAYYYVRHPDADIAQNIYERLLLCARAGALATETRLEIEPLGGTHNILPNDALSRVTLRNLRALANIELTDEETAFSLAIQKTLESPVPLMEVNTVQNMTGRTSKGSTDVGDVSWVVPTSGFRTVCWAPGTPAHSWQATACGATSLARKGMTLAARTLAATAWDLYTKPSVLKAAQEEFSDRLGSRQYHPMLEPGQQPSLDYRDHPGR